MWVGGSSTSPSPHLGARLAFSASQAAVSVQPGSPAAQGAALLDERADLRASWSEQGSTMPSAAAPRALTPLRVSGRSETGAVTCPESDGMAGPITRRSGLLGGGAEAGRRPRRAGSLREAQPPRGPAGGGKVAGPGGAKRAGAVEAPDARRCAGLRVGAFIPRWPLSRVPGGGGSPVAEEAPELTRNPSVASLDLCLAQRGPIQCARSRGAPGKGKISRRITGHWIVRKHVVSRITFFPHCRCPVSVKPKVPGRGAVIPGAFELPGLTS